MTNEIKSYVGPLRFDEWWGRGPTTKVSLEGLANRAWEAGQEAQRAMDGPVIVALQEKIQAYAIALTESGAIAQAALDDNDDRTVRLARLSEVAVAARAVLDKLFINAEFSNEEAVEYGLFDLEGVLARAEGKL